VFAVPANFAKGYILGVDFDDRACASAQHLTIRPHETTTITVQATTQKPWSFLSTVRENGGGRNFWILWATSAVMPLTTYGHELSCAAAATRKS